MSVKISIPVELKPITVPDFIQTTINDKFTDDKINFALKDLPWEALDKLCNEFRKTLFKKADKKDSKGL